MKIECVQEKFKKILSLAERVVGRGNLNLPILSCVLLEAKKGQIIIRSTNLDLGFMASLPVKVEEEGVLAVPAQVLNSFVGNLDGEKSVKLTSDGDNLSARTSKSRATIKCLPAGDFPTIPGVKDGKKISLLAGDLSGGLKAVCYSASVSSVKPELSSVYIYKDGDSLVFVATDSFRLAEKRVRTKGDIKDFDQALIPFKNTIEIIRILEEVGGSLDVCFSKNQVGFVLDGVYLTSRLVEGTFPDYRQIIPKNFQTEAIVLKEDLARSLKVSSIFSDSFSQIGVTVNPEEKKFSLKTQNNTVGENSTNLVATLSGQAVEANFNSRYIADCLQSIGSDSVSLSFAGPSRPAVIHGVSDKSFTYLVMPMNR